MPRLFFFDAITTSSEPALLLAGQTGETVTAWEVLEVSMVSVPGDASAAVGLSARSSVPIRKIFSQTNMTMESVALELGLSKESSEAEVLAAVKAVKRSAMVDQLIEGAVAKGLVAEDQKEHWKKMAQLDFQACKAVIEGIKKPLDQQSDAMSLTGMLSAGIGNQKETNSEDRSTWTFDDWSKKDSVGLLAMKHEKPDMYSQLAKAKYAGA